MKWWPVAAPLLPIDNVLSKVSVDGGFAPSGVEHGLDGLSKFARVGIPNEDPSACWAWVLTARVQIHPSGVADAAVTFLRPDDRVRALVDACGFAGMVANLEPCFARANFRGVARHCVDGRRRGKSRVDGGWWW